MMTLGVAPIGMAEESSRLVYQMGGEPDRMDPTMNDYASGSAALQSLFRGLMKFGESGASIVPAMAESYELSEDGLVYTFHLRPDLKWSDGSPLTAHDFEYSWKRVLNPELSSETAFTLYNLIQGGRECFLEESIAIDDLPIHAVDDLTLTVELYAPTPYFPSLTATTAYMPVKKDVVEADENWEWNDQIYVSNGPFRIKEMRREEKYIFEKNPYYYNADEVKIDEIEYIFLSAAETALLAFNNGEIDIAASVNPDARRQYLGTDNLLLTNRIGYRWYEFRCDREPFSDPRVRRALSIAIDREVLVKNVIETPESPLYGFIPHAYTDVVDPSKTWREVHGNAFEEDVEEAKALLAEAGYPDGEGFPTFRLVAVPGSEHEKTTQALAQMWKQNLNIEAEIQIVESSVYWADTTGTRNAGEFEVCYMGYTGDYLDPSSILFPLMSNENESIQWGNDEYDDLMAQLSAGASGQEREDIIAAAEKLLAEEFPVFPIYSYISQALVSDRVGGFVRNYVGHPNFEYAYIK
jgi:oligopeptide transport system substrate-binding protein